MHNWKRMDPQDQHVNAYVALFSRASNDDIAEGLCWYDSARKYARELAIESALTFETCAAVLAICSQRTPWGRNMMLARRMCVYRQYHGTLSMIAHKARELIEHGANPARVVSGVKVSAFYSAIVGNSDSITIDAHMATIAGLGKGENGKQSAPWGNKYRYIANCVRKAATICGYGDNVAAFQAIVWVAHRRLTGYQAWADSVNHGGTRNEYV